MPPARTTSCLTGLAGCLTGLAIFVLSVLPAAAQQPAPQLPSGWSANVEPKFNTTVIPRKTPPQQRPAPSLGTTISLVAFLTDAGQEIRNGVVWRIYKLGELASDTPRLLHTLRKARALAKLQPGSYAINAAYGRAHLTRKITVKSGDTVFERFVLNAGGLRVTAIFPDGNKVPDNAVTYQIFSDERNQFGDRTQIISNARPGIIFRLNAGIYFISSTYGDANAKVRSDVTVEAGKLTEATVTHSAARVTFKLVARSGGEALADTRWRLTTQKGVIVKQSEGAFPSHILAAGTYVISAQHGNRVYRSQFQVIAGQDAQVEVVMQ